MRAKPDLKAAPRVIEWVLRVGRRREAEGRRDPNHAGHRIARDWNLHPDPARRAQFALVDNVSGVMVSEHDLVHLLGHSAPAHLGFVVSAVIGVMQEQRLDSQGREQFPEMRLERDACAQRRRRREARAGDRHRRAGILGIQDPIGLAAGAAERKTVGLHDAGTAARTDRAVWRALPVRAHAVATADRQGIDAIRWRLNTRVARRPVEFAAVTDRDRRQGLPVGEHLIEHGRPGVDIVVFDRQIGTEAEVDEIVLGPRLKHVLDAFENGVQFLLVVLHRVGVEHAVVIDGGVRPLGA